MTRRHPPLGAERTPTSAKRRHRKEKGPPPQPLAAYTKPSKRHALGKARCQRWEMREGAFWQCPRAARAGVSVCIMHGAGTAKREASGERLPPQMANVGTGRPKAVQILLAQHPEFKALYEHHLSAPIAELLDFRPQLAAAKALVDAYVQRSKLEGDYGPFGSDSSIQRAIDALDRLLRMGERFLAIEAKLGPATQLELAWLRYAFVATINAFVVAEKLEEAKAFCLRKLREARELGIGKETT